MVMPVPATNCFGIRTHRSHKTDAELACLLAASRVSGKGHLAAWHASKANPGRKASGMYQSRYTAAGLLLYSSFGALRMSLNDDDASASSLVQHHCRLLNHDTSRDLFASRNT